MKSLIWKEVRQQLAWFLVAVVLGTWIWFRAANVWDQLVRPVNETGLWGIAVPLFYAFTLAQLQFGRDGDARQFGLLVHRAGGARGYFAAKVIVGVSALAGVIALPVTVWAVTMSLDDPDAILIHWSRLPQTWLFCVPTLLVYAIGVLSTQLRRGVVLRWVTASFGITGAFLVMWPLVLLTGPGEIAVYAWVGLDVLVALAVLWLARSLLLSGRDRDLPLRDGQLAGVAALAFLVLLPIATFIVGTNESSALGMVVEEKPAVLHDPRTDEWLVAVRTEDGWRRQGADGREITQQRSDLFVFDEHHPLDLVHYAGSPVVEGLENARASMSEAAAPRLVSDSAPPGSRSGDPRVFAVRADSDPRLPLGERWSVQFTLEEQDGAVHVDASRTADGLPPLQFSVARPDGRFSARAGFLESRRHVPLVLDRADGTLWKVQLQENSALVVPLELPGGDRVSAVEPLFQRKEALLGRYQQKYFSSDVTNTGCLFVGGKGKYVLLDDELVPFTADARPEDTVSAEEVAQLARCSVTSSWPDAFTEEIRVEQLPDHKVLFELTAEPSTRSARTAAAVYSALAFLRPPGGVLQERFSGRTTHTGMMSAPFPKERQLFAEGGHPFLFALLMLSGSFQLFLGWRWLARSGAGIATRVVYMLLIFVGGVAALVFTRLLLPRHVRASPRLERQAGLEPLPARA